MTLSVFNLFAVLLIAWIGGVAAKRIGYPAILGELIAGVVFGPPLPIFTTARSPRSKPY